MPERSSASWLAHARPGTPGAPLDVVDLGAGTGSNLRYLAPRLGGRQHWRLVDDDPRLLAAALTSLQDWARVRGAAAIPSSDGLELRGADGECLIRCEQRDLARSLADLPLPAGALVTAAALLDLVTEPWLTELITRCRAARAPVCFALSYDGRTVCTPVEPEDGEVLELFNRHQGLDKGFGPALGPHAANRAAALLSAAGYRVLCARSDWVIDTRHGVMQRALLDGWLAAVLELAPPRRTALTDWHRRRSAHVAAGRSTLRVGHVDVVAWP